jgi:D-beta-D-heptose 7-phosphate kinase/D-beta-D-heptose 1-phosphate adenosyltransferase
MEFSGIRVLVVGDIMLDKYYIGKVERISPEAPVPVVSVTREESRLGGAANVAHNISSLGGRVSLCGVLGRDLLGRELERLAARERVDMRIVKTDQPTITKARVIGGRQQIVRIDYEQRVLLAPDPARRLEEGIAAAASDANVVIISDYGKGVVSRELCRFVLDLANRLQLPVIVDPKGVEWDKYRGAAWITPNLKELGDIAGRPIDNEDRPVEEHGREIRLRHALDRLLVTRGERGMSLITGTSALHIPTRAREVFDVSGAGDTVVATLALALAAGMSDVDSIRLANKAAGIVVNKMGTATLSPGELDA